MFPECVSSGFSDREQKIGTLVMRNDGTESMHRIQISDHRRCPKPGKKRSSSRHSRKFAKDASPQRDRSLAAGPTNGWHAAQRRFCTQVRRLCTLDVERKASCMWGCIYGAGARSPVVAYPSTPSPSINNYSTKSIILLEFIGSALREIPLAAFMSTSRNLPAPSQRD